MDLISVLVVDICGKNVIIVLDLGVLRDLFVPAVVDHHMFLSIGRLLFLLAEALTSRVVFLNKGKIGRDCVLVSKISFYGVLDTRLSNFLADI